MLINFYRSRKITQIDVEEFGYSVKKRFKVKKNFLGGPIYFSVGLAGQFF
jgi:hypothetical protein